MEQPSELTYKALNEHIDGMKPHQSMSVKLSSKSKYGYGIALIAVVSGLVAMKLLPHDQWYTVAAAGLFLLVELIGIAVAVIAEWPLRLPGFKADRVEYAEQLDFEFVEYTNVIEWIVQHPRERIADLADYAELRQERFRERQPLLVGGIEKLGILPVLVAVYGQIKTTHWPPNPSWLEILFYGLLAWFYWLCVVSISTRQRGSLLELVLKRALIAKDKLDATSKLDLETAGLISTVSSTRSPSPVSALPTPHSTDQYTSD